MTDKKIPSTENSARIGREAVGTAGINSISRKIEALDQEIKGPEKGLGKFFDKTLGNPSLNIGVGSGALLVGALGMATLTPATIAISAVAIVAGTIIQVLNSKQEGEKKGLEDGKKILEDVVGTRMDKETVGQSVRDVDGKMEKMEKSTTRKVLENINKVFATGSVSLLAAGTVGIVTLPAAPIIVAVVSIGAAVMSATVTAKETGEKKGLSTVKNKIQDILDVGKGGSNPNAQNQQKAMNR